MRRSILAAAVAAAVLVPAASAVAAKPPVTFDYALIGDTPYGSTQIAAFPSQIQKINNDPSISTTIHVGDIKNGSSRCDTSYFQTIRNDFDTFAKPFVYIPGDNEWTDCHRTNNGGYQPAGPAQTGSPIITGGEPSRLDVIRSMFFPNPRQSLGQTTRPVRAQKAPYVENVMWAERKVQFATFNLPGSNNDKLPWFGALETPALQAIQADEVAKRTAADIAWLKLAFDRAGARNAPAVVLALQADMWDPAITGDPSQYDAFTPFVQELATQVKAFGKPVLLVNGDSHVFMSDTPLADPLSVNNSIYGVTDAVPNLTRITVNGSGTANQGYVKLHVTPSAPVPFTWSLIPYS